MMNSYRIIFGERLINTIFAWRNQRFLLHDCCNFCCIIVAKNVVFLFAKTAVLLNAVYSWWQGETSGAFDMTKEKAGTSGFFPTKGPWANWILMNDNPKITSPGVWKINFDTETNIMSMVEVQWSIIGSSAPNNPLLNYYPDEKVWKASLNLNAGSFKFATIPVSFGDPTVTYGKSESISPLASDGEEIKITESGSYEVILNLNNPPYYNYQLTKK